MEQLCIRKLDNSSKCAYRHPSHLSVFSLWSSFLATKLGCHLPDCVKRKNKYYFQKLCCRVYFIIIKEFHLSYVGSTTENREFMRLKTMGHEWATAFGHSVSTLSFSKKANKQLAHGSAPFRLSEEELLVLFSS